jgi:hypothetical protein
VTRNDYHLTEESPAVNAGIELIQTVKGLSLKPTLVYKDTAKFDSRPVHDEIDLGAYEYGSLIPVENELQSKINELTVYPNPATDDINLEFISESDIVSIRIIDCLGNCVFSSEYQRNPGINYLRIKPENINSGLYFLRMTYGKQIKVNPIMFIKEQ